MPKESEAYISIMKKVNLWNNLELFIYNFSNELIKRKLKIFINYHKLVN